MKAAVLDNRERGMILITTLLLMLLMSALLAGFAVAVLGDQQFRGVDKDRATAFYSAHAGLEKLTSDLGGLFQTNFAPTGTQINALEANAPSLTGIEFVTPTGTSGYQIGFAADVNGNPTSQALTIRNGPYQGLIGQVTPYQIDVTARTTGGADVHVRRELQTVTIPVFQFGTFSDTDLGFHSAATFSFGGRVHSNGNLFLAGNATLTLSDKVTSAGEIIRKYLMNGYTVSGNYTGNVRVLRAPGLYRDLALTEQSLQNNIGSAVNEPTWTNISIGTYNGNIRNIRTGARRLDLPLITVGGTPIDLIKRPATQNENTTNPTLYNSRYFTMASLRILLSDTANDILNLPGVTATAPVSLDTAMGAWYTVDANHPPLATSVGPAGPAGVGTTTNGATAASAANIIVNSLNGFNATAPNWIFVTSNANPAVITPVYCTSTTTAPSARFTGCTGTPAANNGAAVDTYYRTTAGTGLNGGFIKIEKQDGNGNWTDVTAEILNLGIAGKNLFVAGCAEPNLNAVIRFERLRDRPSTVPGNACGNGSTQPRDYWPNTLFDTREGNFRDDQALASTNVFLGGVMHYVELDMNNLRRWWQGAIGVSGPGSMNVTGYVVYFSDRRLNRNALNLETGEYGFEDFVNPASNTGAASGTLNTGEDVNANGTLEIYGQTPILAAGAATPLDANARPWTNVSQVIGRINRALFFRRALKLVNGAQGNLMPPGIAVIAENPVYVQGNYNAANGFGNPHVAASIIADAVTVLSNNWNDRNSFTSPQDPSNRTATTTWYRMAVIAGTGRSFPRSGVVNNPPENFGTDGGIHNFLRYLEDWSGDTVNYRGSIAILYNNRQGVGTFKQAGNNNVYGTPATRAYAFDVEFLQPSLLPPRTPVFRDINTLSFTQVMRE
jgi:hypothetical protein